MNYQLDKWKHQDWRKGSRHLRRWGQVSAFHGQSLEEVCVGADSLLENRYEDGVKTFEAVARRRAKRGYHY